MKQIYLLLIASSLLASSCISPKQAIKKGRYDTAYYLAYKKVRKNASKDKRVLLLEEAFNIVQQRDLDRIEFLKTHHDPAQWEEIYDRYDAIAKRQEQVKLLPDLIIEREGFRTANLKLINIDKGLSEAREQAADYSYARAVDLLNRGGRQNARDAYYALEHISKYYSSYKDIARLKSMAQQHGTSEIFVRSNPGHALQIFPSIGSELSNINLVHLNNQWQLFHTSYDTSMMYDYTVNIDIETVQYRPEQINESRYSEHKEIQDGWNYVLDKNGNVLKDSLGNDIKTPRMITISCAVIETHQLKTVSMVGKIVMINNHSGQKIHTDRITAESVFQNSSAVAIGDLHALSKETLEKTKHSYIPFPSDYNMLKDAAAIYNQVSQDILRKKNDYLM
ncbi:MAG: hypothetical protein HKN22_02900 [Bacteroidia bacterium]|nr:hypothetical protein [Bacteroidia bacterium]